MSTTVTQTESPALATVPLITPAQSKCMKLDGTDPVYGDWRDDLVRDG